MTQVFISHSKNDHIFAELARIELNKADISVWIDHDDLGAGDDWREGIDQGITESDAILLVLSEESTQSLFVTYEWASAMGKGKPVIPVQLKRCELHPKIEPIQFLDFSKPGDLPWKKLVKRIRESESENEASGFEPEVARQGDEAATSDPAVDKILEYLNKRGYQVASFERLQKRVDENLSDDDFKRLIDEHRHILRHAKLKDGRPGVAKLR